MKISNFKFLILTTFLIGIFTPITFAHAILEDSTLEPVSTLGKCTPKENFNMHFLDDDGNIENFILTIDPSETLLKEMPITDSKFYNGNNVKLELKLEKYDPLSNNEFSIVIGTTMATTNIYHFTTDYIVDMDQQIRILPGSFFNVIEKDDGVFTGADDQINLELMHDGENNIMYHKQDEKGGYGIKEGKCDLDWAPEKALPNLKALIKMSIPLKFDGPRLATTQVGDKDIITNEKSSNYKKEIVNKVIATIKIDESKMTFDDGLPKETYDITKIEPEEEKIAQKKAIGFGGYGFKVPGKGDYKGISTESSLEQLIIGLTNFVLGFVSLIAVLVLIYGGYLWILDRGEDQLAEKSKKIIASAVIGILLIISAYTIVNTVLDMNDPYPASCGIGLDIASGDHSLDAECSFEGTKAVTAGIGSLVGGVAGGDVGLMTGGLLGGLLGGDGDMVGADNGIFQGLLGN